MINVNNPIVNDFIKLRHTIFFIYTLEDLKPHILKIKKMKQHIELDLFKTYNGVLYLLRTIYSTNKR